MGRKRPELRAMGVMMNKKPTIDQLKEAQDFLAMRSLTSAMDKKDDGHKERTLECNDALKAAIDELEVFRSLHSIKQKLSVQVATIAAQRNRAIALLRKVYFKSQEIKNFLDGFNGADKK